jgi:hypothetical protein
MRWRQSLGLASVAACETRAVENVTVYCADLGAIKKDTTNFGWAGADVHLAGLHERGGTAPTSPSSQLAWQAI